jgi:bacterioferritin
MVAERTAIETYREMVRYFGDKGPTRVLLERVLAQEEDHADDMRDPRIDRQC